MLGVLAMIHTLTRESLVLLLGVMLQGAIVLAFSNAVKDLDLLHGIVAPIFVCVYRLALYRTPARAVSSGHYAVQQLSMALSLVVLLLFEAGMGMFMGAQGIPAGVWTTVMMMGLLYLALVCLAESLSRANSTNELESTSIAGEELL